MMMMAMMLMMVVMWMVMINLEPVSLKKEGAT